MIKNLLDQLDIYMGIRKKNSVAAYEVDDFLEHICDPYATSGWWTRKFRFYIYPEDPALKDADLSNISVKVNFSFGIAEDEPISKCTSSCFSVRDSCEFYLEDIKVFDSLAVAVSDLSKDPGPLFTEDHFNTLNESYCMKIVDCYAKKTVVKSVTEALNSINVSKREKPRMHYLQEKIEPAEESNYTNEFFAYNHMGSENNTKAFTEIILGRLYKLRDRAREKNKTHDETR